MKIYGTAKGGALSHKDFGVAFGGGSVSEFINATGGDSVADDGDYRVRTFTSSGTFEITSNTGEHTYDVLVIGGGASGGNDNGGYGSGGGGAGGMVKLTSQAGTIQTYAVTIGAGGAAPTTAGQNGSNGSNQGGSGGAGASDSITGSSVCYAGGGAGKGQTAQGTATCGGTAGNSGLAGTDGLGGGSGGADGDPVNAGKGGNGVVIVRYQFQ